ncbi:hypothetical protein WJX73_001268 [Symbiochloris irregularis]|uniref:Uncharacterized protein n=1 Tax=Symbiochloris irregularis TaxID=706552 RepID=A0AAW1PUX5_9CHLO
MTPRSYVPKPLRSSSEGGTDTVVNVNACAETPSTSRAAMYHPVLNPMRGKGLLHVIDGSDYIMTLIQITGAILFWRGIWCSWDALFGFSVWSEVSSVVLGLALMTGARWIRGLMDENTASQPVGGSNHNAMLLDKRRSSGLEDEDGT